MHVHTMRSPYTISSMRAIPYHDAQVLPSYYAFDIKYILMRYAISIPSFIMLGSAPATPLPVLSISIDGCPCVCPCYNSSIKISTLILAKKNVIFIGTRIVEIIWNFFYVIYFMPACRIKF